MTSLNQFQIGNDVMYYMRMRACLLRFFAASFIERGSVEEKEFFQAVMAGEGSYHKVTILSL